jgi:CBS domain containing-hemolysin-like protein
MTLYSINVMWAIVLFGILLWTTACVVLNAALRRGMGIMGMALSYGALVWMLFDLPWIEVAATWMLFAVVGGVITMGYELWARRRYAGTARAPRPIVRIAGPVLWPAMIPDAVGLMLNDAGIIPADERSETHEEDTRRITAELPVARRGV